MAVDAGADAVGFVFYEKSPRYVTVETAREIVGKLPQKVEKVGVFVNELSERVRQLAEEAGLTAVQCIHGDERIALPRANGTIFALAATSSLPVVVAVFATENVSPADVRAVQNRFVSRDSRRLPKIFWDSARLWLDGSARRDRQNI